MEDKMGNNFIRITSPIYAMPSFFEKDLESLMREHKEFKEGARNWEGGILFREWASPALDIGYLFDPTGNKSIGPHHMVSLKPEDTHQDHDWGVGNGYVFDLEGYLLKIEPADTKGLFRYDSFFPGYIGDLHEKTIALNNGLRGIDKKVFLKNLRELIIFTHDNRIR